MPQPSKEEILHAWQGKGLVAALQPAMLEESPDQAPLAAVRHCLLKLAARYEDKDSIVIDRLFQSTEGLTTCRDEAEATGLASALVERKQNVGEMSRRHIPGCSMDLA